MPRVGRALLVSLAALIAQGLPAHGQPAPLVLQGVVVSVHNGAALPRVRVAATAGSRRVEPVLTDGQGRFTLTLAEASPFTLSLAKAGYAAASLPISRERAGARDVLRIQLARGAAISGHVAEPSGEPAVAAPVVARRLDAGPDDQNGLKEFRTDVNDLGEYRLGGLPAGRYQVTAWPVPSTRQVSLTQAGVPVMTAAPTAQSVIVDVGTADESTGVDLIAEPWRSRVMDIPLAGDFVLTPPAIHGRVSGAGGEPIQGAQLRLIDGQLGAGRGTTTDAEGRFQLNQLPLGAVTLEVGKTGFATTTYGQTRSGDPPTLLDVQRDVILDADVTLHRGSVVTGTIVDEFGEPLEGVIVQTLQVRRVEGRDVASRAGWDRRTDDRGQFRLFNLPPGEYLVAASVDAASTGSDRRNVRGYVPVFFPGTTSVGSATPVRLDIGQDAAGIDLVFTPSFAVNVAGMALDAAENPVVGSVRLFASQRSAALATEPRTTRIGPDGTFSLANIPPGDYVVQANGEAGPGRPAEFGVEFLTVKDGDPAPLVIRTASRAVLSGRVTVEGDPAPVEQTPAGIPANRQPYAGLSLRVHPTDLDRSPESGNGVASLAVSSDGTFYINGLVGPARLALATAPAGFYLKSILVDGVDMIEAPFDFGSAGGEFTGAEIVLSRGGAIEGRISPERAGVMRDSTVVVFSADRARWGAGSQHVKVVRAARDGAFRVDALPPGSYLIAAVEGPPPGGGDWRSRDALEPVAPGATRVSVRESETATITLRVARP
jgi:hypothetical protein